ncbi:MAG TPA: hypothetical protein VFI31_26650 [Pirellulales bacterium]|nr:hypothetical protein [Pirellulales bacterium]
MILPGEFWVADVPFTDQTASKKRPILVLWLDAADAVIVWNNDCCCIGWAPSRRTMRSKSNWRGPSA